MDVSMINLSALIAAISNICSRQQPRRLDDKPGKRLRFSFTFQALDVSVVLATSYSSSFVDGLIVAQLIQTADLSKDKLRNNHVTLPQSKYGVRLKL